MVKNNLQNIDFKLKLYKKMLLIREFENAALSLYSKNLIRGSIHVYIGEEAIAVGICSNIDISKGDCITSTHRGHGHVLAMGADINAMMAELLGRETGLCKGRGGSMHIADVDSGVYGANGIVGAGIPIACGLALASSYMKKDFVSVTFFGDGAANEGVLYESFNLASVWNLPVVFVCENNLYAQTTPAKETHSVLDVKSRASSFGIESIEVDGNDVEEIYKISGSVIEKARKEKKPKFIEAKTYRFKGHWQGDPEIYRERDELKYWMENKDPVNNYKNKLIENFKVSIEKMSKIEKEVKLEIETAERFAVESKEPDKDTLMDNIYA